MGKTPTLGQEFTKESKVIIDTANNDAVKPGKNPLCGRGVHNILSALGVPHQNGNGHTWDDTLPTYGWVKVDGLRPEDAPPTAVLTYDRDKNYRGKSGGAGYGHVEVKAYDAEGVARYASITASTKPGGTVYRNYTGAWVHENLLGKENVALLQGSAHDRKIALDRIAKAQDEVGQKTPVVDSKVAKADSAKGKDDLVLASNFNGQVSGTGLSALNAEFVQVLEVLTQIVQALMGGKFADFLNTFDQPHGHQTMIAQGDVHNNASLNGSA